MWAKIAEEMAVPWRAAEAMHWQLGEADMARRAGVVPFSLAAVNVDQSQATRRSPSRGQVHIQSHGGAPRDIAGSTRYGRSAAISPMAGRAHPARHDSLPPPPAPLPPSILADPDEVFATAGLGPGGPGLAPIQNQPQTRGASTLPGLAELTTGVSPYSTPAYSMGGPPHISPAPSGTASPGPGALPPPFQYPPSTQEFAGSKRRASPGTETARETSRRRHLDPW